jgi:cysteine protease ATG4
VRTRRVASPQASVGLPASEAPLFLLGERYDFAPPPGAEEEAAAAAVAHEAQRLLADWLSRVWVTYRRDFPPLSPGGLTTDAGWGCTLRSGQMLLAHALTLRARGRAWRWRPRQAAEAGGGGAGADDSHDNDDDDDDAAHVALLRLFADDPRAPFGIHALCAAGALAGVSPGAWLGPHALCAALNAAAARAAAAASANGDDDGAAPLLPRGTLLIRVVAAGGGGAPTLFADDVADASRAEAEAAAAASASASASHHPPLFPPLPPSPAGGAGWTPVLLLVPLVLGLGRTVNPAYVPQLCGALSLRGSCGVVGGRPGASLFLTGVQAGQVLYLDPHEVQPAAALPAERRARGDDDDDDAVPAADAPAPDAPAAPPPPPATFPVGSYHCGALRHAPLAGMDPSCALGFYAHTFADWAELVDALRELAHGAPAAPLLTVASREAPARKEAREEEANAANAAAGVRALDEEEEEEQGGGGGGGGGGEDEWTML